LLLSFPCGKGSCPGLSANLKTNTGNFRRLLASALAFCLFHCALLSANHPAKAVLVRCLLLSFPCGKGGCPDLSSNLGKNAGKFPRLLAFALAFCLFRCARLSANHSAKAVLGRCLLLSFPCGKGGCPGLSANLGTSYGKIARLLASALVFCLFRCARLSTNHSAKAVLVRCLLLSFPCGKGGCPSFEGLAFEGPALEGPSL
jgi:hypothetical protein